MNICVVFATAIQHKSLLELIKMLKKIINSNFLSVNSWLHASTLSLTVLIPSLLGVSPAMGVKLNNGSVAFNNPPRLIRTASSFGSPNTPSAYQFTISVPKNAGEPLEAVTIVQQPNAQTIPLDISQNRAFKGDSFAGGSALHLASIGGSQSQNSHQVTVVFNPPVTPGNTVTVELRSQGNPTLGVYLFGVTAYPAGENGVGQFLGYGRLQFYK
jgi:hypothetical protein